jgi:MraZ protein
MRGNIFAKADGKGRLKLPATFRAAIESRYGNEFFVTSLDGDSVLIYPLEVWKRIEDQLAEKSSFKPAVKRFRNSTNYYGQVAEMDAQGRILIHPFLRARAGIDGEVAVIGQHDHLEVWNRSTLEQRLKAQPLTDNDLEELGV